MKQLLKIIFPSCCLFCKAVTQDDLLLCADCWSKLEFIAEPKCKTCSFPFQFDVGSSNICAACLHQKPCFDSAEALLKYNFYSKTIVHKLKYSDQLHLASFFARLIVDRLQVKITQSQLIIPVPMHRKRLFVRKYNQAALLASSISKLTNVPFVANALIKKRCDIPQTQLNRDQRLENVQKSFVAAPSLVKDKKVALVDDVYTTGATLNECAKVLKEAGCADVHVITLAKVVV